MLNGCGVKLVGQGQKHGFTGTSVVREDAYLDEAVGVECGVGFFFDSGGKTITTDHDDRVKVMGFSAMHFALGWGQLYLRHNRIIGEIGIYEISSKKQ